MKHSSPPSRTDKFLCECANLPSLPGNAQWPARESVPRLLKKYGDFLWVEPWPGFTDDLFTDLLGWGLAQIGKWPAPQPKGIREQHDAPARRDLMAYFQVAVLRVWLRSLWQARSEREGFWAMMGLVGQMAQTLGVNSAHAPGFTSLADVLSPGSMPPLLEPAIWELFQAKQRGRARMCENPSCPAPYFLASRRDQRFCGAACAAPAQREWKRAWWRESGADWRERQKAKQQKSGRRKR